MDRHRARPCPPGGDPGGRRLPAALPLAALVVVALVTATAPTGAAPLPAATRTVVTAPTPSLTLQDQSGWVTPGQVFDLHLRTASSLPTSSLGLTVSVYPCLSTLSGFDQSLDGTGLGTPVSSTGSPLPLSSLPTVAGGGVELAMPVVVGNGASSASAPAFTIHLLPVGGQCQSFPDGVFPVRVQLVDTAGGSVVGSFVTHLVTTEATVAAQPLRVAVVLPVQLTLVASRAPSPAALLARPTAALSTPAPAAVAALTATVATIADKHPTVPVTLQVSGQTAAVLDTPAHQSTVTQLDQLADTPSVHELTAAPYTPVDATGLVDAGLGSELALQVSRGIQQVAAVTGRPAPAPGGSGGLGAWVTGDGVDASTVAALAGTGYRQLVLPSSQLSSTPSDGSTTSPFTVSGTRGTQLTAMASDDDLTARFTSDPGDPVLAAHQLAAELAQLYYERPNDVSVRAVMAVAPTTWDDDPAFVDALLASLDGNPVVEAETTSQLFATFPGASTCRSGCRLVPTGTSVPPAAAVRTQRARVDSFATAAVGVRSLAQQLGDLVLGGEAEALRPSEQTAVLDNAGAAVDAQVGQVAVEDGQSVTLTARSGRIPVTIVSNAPYPVSATLVLSSDKLLFPDGETQWSAPVLLPPRHTFVYYVKVQSRASGVFRMDVTLHAPAGALRLATGELSVRSTSSSVVGVVLTVGAVAVLVVWWVRTSLRRRAARRAEDQDADDAGPVGDARDEPTVVGSTPGDGPGLGP